MAECGNGARDLEPGSPPRGEGRRFTTHRLEKRTAMARQTWPEFWRDLGMRFLVAAGAVLIVLAIIWLVGLFVR